MLKGVIRNFQKFTKSVFPKSSTDPPPPPPPLIFVQQMFDLHSEGYTNKHQQIKPFDLHIGLRCSSLFVGNFFFFLKLQMTSSSIVESRHIPTQCSRHHSPQSSNRANSEHAQTSASRGQSQHCKRQEVSARTIDKPKKKKAPLTKKH